MHTIYRSILLALAATAGLLIAVSALLLVGMAAVAWCARAGWLKLTGRPVKPFMRRLPGSVFRPMAAPADVVDVEAKRLP
jgi:hypothetical protein